MFDKTRILAAAREDSISREAFDRFLIWNNIRFYTSHDAFR